MVALFSGTLDKYSLSLQWVLFYIHEFAPHYRIASALALKPVSGHSPAPKAAHQVLDQPASACFCESYICSWSSSSYWSCMILLFLQAAPNLRQNTWLQFESILGNDSIFTNKHQSFQCSCRNSFPSPGIMALLLLSEHRGGLILLQVCNGLFGCQEVIKQMPAAALEHHFLWALKVWGRVRCQQY